MTRKSRRQPLKGETIADYVVGKGKTPLETRWKKGCESPNPKGRPPKMKPGQRKLDHYLDQIVELPGPDGKIERMTKREVAYLQIANRAAKGDLAAFRLIQAHDAAKENGDNAEPLLFDEDLTNNLLAEYKNISTPRVRKSRSKSAASPKRSSRSRRKGQAS